MNKILLIWLILLCSACGTTPKMTADTVYTGCKLGFMEDEGYYIFKGPGMYGLSERGWNSVILLKAYKKGKSIIHMVSVKHPNNECISPLDAYDADGHVLKVVLEEELIDRHRKTCMGETFSAVISEKYLLDHVNKDIAIKFVGKDEDTVKIPAYYIEGYLGRLRKEGFLN
ncbi:hypothetical protein [Desulfocurvibacter africanus]|uniref:hypothetical protein n=1 Tax=Desulfocurvibacter africanus TaxID=873 RepID=UPI001183355D|nr:hypothetical protein [Desulfocurvibacter africanus]